jgi:hypothetical protein
MHLRVEDRRIRYAAFLLLAVTINAVDGALTRQILDPGKRTLVAAAASLDIVVVVSAIYYWLLVRPGIRGRSSLFPIAIIGALHACFLYPNARAVTAGLAGLCEVGLLSFVVVQVRRVSRRGLRCPGDPISSIQSVLEALALPPFIARLLATEIGILYYASFSWRAKPHVPAGAKAFFMHRKNGQGALFYAVAAASSLEMLPMHLVIRQWNPTWAWAATGISLYGMIWLIGLGRSLELRPVLIGPEFLDLRYGLLFALRVPCEMIASFRRADSAGPSHAFVLPKGSQPDFCIDLACPLEAEGLFGVRRHVSLLALAPDDPAGFERALGELLS